MAMYTTNAKEVLLLIIITFMKNIFSIVVNTLYKYKISAVRALPITNAKYFVYIQVLIFYLSIVEN